jgi:ADP-ribosylglycohydrolase
MEVIMNYPQSILLGNIKGREHLVRQLEFYIQLKQEYGAKGINAVLKRTEKEVLNALKAIKQLKNDSRLSVLEPNGLKAIKALRPNGPRRLWKTLGKDYQKRLEGALLGRMAGCTLGAPVEFWEIERMKNLAKETGVSFPPRSYWKYVPDPYTKRYLISPREQYTLSKMKGVPVDDDIAYTLLGLLILEESGPGFTTRDVGRAWKKYLPMAYTAERIALENLKKGVPASKAGEVDNPFCEWIGADIRSDPWGYAAPGWPEKAAELAYRDAYISHRRQGLYGAMFFAAAIAAGFTVKNPVDALRIGLTEIPKACALAKGVKWALRISPRIKNYKTARAAVDRQFKGMSGVHTIINACLTIFGITIGKTGFTRVIGETVAMGLDNDCTAATAGSIVGAVVGKQGIPNHWYRPFKDTVHSYLIGKRRFTICGLIRRFTLQAARIMEKK